MHKFVIVTALSALPFAAAADRWPAQRPAVVQAPAQRYSQEKLQQIRQSLVAQIAIRDEAEGAMRAPTAEEAAAFALSSGPTPESIALPNGGVALRLDASLISMAVAERSPDGKVKVTHAGANLSGAAIAATGGTNDR